MQTNHPHFPAQLPISTLTLRAYERREQLWQQVLNDPAQILFVAEDETGKIIGFVNGGPEREGDSVYRGELHAIYVLQEVHRRGLGRRLVSSNFSKRCKLGPAC